MLPNGWHAHSQSFVVSEPVVLFANKNQMLTLLPSGSIQKDYTDETGQAKTSQVKGFAKLLLTFQIRKAKKDFPILDKGQTKMKSKVDLAWEAYNENEKSYNDRNQDITEIADMIKKAKELTVKNDRLANGILTDAMYSLLKEIEKCQEGKEIPQLLKFREEHSIDDIGKIIENVHNSGLLVYWPVRSALDKLEEVLVLAGELKANPRNAVATLEEELAKMLEPKI